MSVIIPTLNCSHLISDCLESIHRQTYKSIEIVVVDAFSRDGTAEIAERNGAKVVKFGPRQSMPFEKFFGTPHQQNYGAHVSTGKFIYLVDSDMRLTDKVIETCVDKAKSEETPALIVPEISYGEGFWCRCKVLERSLHRGNDALEAPRFLSRQVWNELGGVDPSLGGFYDWDLADRLRRDGHRIGRIDEAVFHFEGKLNIRWTMRKKYIYGKTAIPYLRRRKRDFLRSKYVDRITPLRILYLRKLPLLAHHPSIALGIAIMKFCEFGAAGAGIVAGFLEKHSGHQLKPQCFTASKKTTGSSGETPHEAVRR